MEGTIDTENMRIRATRLALPATLLMGMFLVAVYYADVPRATAVLEEIRDLGVWGPLVLASLYTIWCTLLIPASVLTLSAGFLFGLPIGGVAAILGSTVGACVAFLVGRTVAREWVARRMASNARFVAIDRVVGYHGFRIVLLSRLSPISPFTLLNYLYGLTRVSFREYALGTLLGVIPGTLIFTYFGAGLRSLAEVVAHARGEAEPTVGQRAFFWVGLLIALIVAVSLSLLARRALREAMGPTAKEEPHRE